MNEKSFSLVRSWHEAASVVLISIVAVAQCILLLFVGYRQEEAGLIILTAVFICLFLGMALYYLSLLTVKGCITPEAVELRLFGRAVWKYPREAVKVICTGSWYRGRYRRQALPYISICCHSPEELTALGEKQIASSWLSRGDLPFRKRKAGWQEKFAREYLWKRMKRGNHFRFSKDILWLEWTDDIQIALEEAFPEAVWLEIDHTEPYLP